MDELFETLGIDEQEELEDFDIVGEFDTDDDGVADSFMLDIDGDGIGDLLFSDDDGDGIYESAIGDIDDDGILERYDFEDDFGEEFSISDEIEYFDDIEEGYFDSDENNPEAIGTEIYDEYGYLEPGVTEGIIGDPTDAMESWHSQTGNNCANDAQEFVAEDILGIELSENELEELATENGWFEPESGTPVMNIGNLLEYYGIETEQSFGNSFDDLRESLADGNKIIVTVDAEELWNGENNEWFLPGMDANHAIQVVGIDERDPDDIRVIINDSGVANGKCVTVPADIFMDAWEDGDNFMVEAFADNVD